MKQAKMVIIAVYVLSTLILIPNYITNQIEEVHINNRTLYILKDLKLATNQTSTIVLYRVSCGCYIHQN
jgi:hypothetical protein